MLTIRREQMKPFEESARRRFAQRLAEHARAIFPDRCAELGAQGLLALVDEGVARARRYGVHLERDVALFVDLMLALGARFDEDPELAWARKILEDDFTPDATLRMQLLHQAALGHLRGTGSERAGG
jgi:hypothetical protein